jgi:hypothetical protein
MASRRDVLKFLVAAVPAIGLLGCESLPMLGGKGGDIGSVIGKQLGLSGDQAKGGIGSVLTLAKEKLGGADFDRIAKVIPGADKYLAAAGDSGAVTGGKVGDMNGLNAALGRLGLNAEQSAKLPTAVTEQVGKLGGGDLKSLLAGALK